MIIIIIILILLVFAGIYRSEKEAETQKVIEHHELSYKLFNKGTDTSSLKIAKESYASLSDSYSNIKEYANDRARACYEEDIEEIRQNAEALAYDRWEKNASRYLFKIETAYSLIADHDFNSIDKAYDAAKQLLKTYDSLCEWTGRCLEENREIWSSVDLWDELNEAVMSVVNDPDHRCGPEPVRKRIEKFAADSLEAMRPEYLRRQSLKRMILQYIADEGSVQRSLLLKISFAGFSQAEVQSCYRGLVNAHSITEEKRGQYYFSYLPGQAAAKAKSADDLKSSADDELA